MITDKDIRVEGSRFERSFVKLTGLKIKDVYGYISDEFGDPVFKITSLVLENDYQIIVEGEHDMPYMPPEQDVPNFDYDTLQRLGEEAQ